MVEAALKNGTIKQSWIILICLVWVTAVSCNPNISPTPAAIEPLTTARATATVVVTTISEPTTTLETAGTAKPTQTPTPTLTPISTETPTPVPTLSPDEALTVVTTLYETNGGCLLPCWWGFTPGQTGWITAKEFLTPIADAIYEGIDPPTHLWNVEIYLPNTYYTGLDAGRSVIHNYRIRGDTIQAFEVWISEPSFLFTPSHILKIYGNPEEIYLRSWQGGTYILVTLFYPHYGFRLTYPLDAGINENGFISACFEDNFPNMTIWFPGLDLSFTETYSLFHREDTGDYQIPLEDSAGMDVQTFFETFSDPDIPICLETQWDIWPGY